MTGTAVMAAYLFVVVAMTGVATGLPWTLLAADPPERGWFPGGEDDEPAPAPQPEQAVRVPTWARP